MELLLTTRRELTAVESIVRREMRVLRLRLVDGWTLAVIGFQQPIGTTAISKHLGCSRQQTLRSIRELEASSFIRPDDSGALRPRWRLTDRGAERWEALNKRLSGCERLARRELDFEKHVENVERMVMHLRGKPTEGSLPASTARTCCECEKCPCWCHEVVPY